MSAPARQVRARQAERPRARTTPSHRLRVVRPRSTTRRGTALRFWAVSLVLIVVLLAGMAALYAVIAQGAFSVRDLRERQAALERANGDLRLTVDRLTAPRRLEAWAAEHRLVPPAAYEILEVPDGPSRARTGGVP